MEPSDQKEKETPVSGDAEAEMIPVLTVLKKGAILKHLFLNIPTPPPSSPNDDVRGDGDEGRLLVGRHPNCHVVLDHPSVSRFHLELLARPASRELAVTDLSSVHGTWVCGRRIDSGVPVSLAEGDELRVGASTRAYFLRWVTLADASRLEFPLAPLPEEEKEETKQEQGSIASGDSLDVSWAPPIPSVPPMPESVMDSSPSAFSYEFSFQGDLIGVWKESEEVTALSSADGSELQSLRSSVLSEPGIEDKMAAEDSPVPPPIAEARVMSSCLLSRRSNKSINSLRTHTGRSREMIAEVLPDTTLRLEDNHMESVRKLPVFGDDDNEEDEEVYPSDKKKLTLAVPRSQKLKNVVKGLMQGSPSNGVEEAYPSDKENLTPAVMASQKQKEVMTALLQGPPLNGMEVAYPSDKENLTPIALSSQKQKKLVKALLQGSPLNGVEEAYPSDKKNLTPAVSASQKQKAAVNGLLQGSPLNGVEVVGLWNKKDCTQIFYGNDEIEKGSTEFQQMSLNLDLEEDGYNADRENWIPESPNDFTPKKLISYYSRKEEEESCAPNKENQTPKLSRDPKIKKPISENLKRIESAITKKRVERIPFQTLLENTPSKTNSPGSNANSLYNGSADLRSREPISENSWVNGREILKRGVERIPFQSLLDNSASKSKSPYSGSGDLKAKETLSEKNQGIERGKKVERIPFQTLLDKSVTYNGSGGLKSREPISENSWVNEREIARRGERIPCQSLLDNSASKFKLPDSGSGNLEAKETLSENNQGLEREKKVAKIPFQDNSVSSKSSVANSDSQNATWVSSENQFQKSVSKTAAERKKKWCIIADTSCFTNEESRRSLQLLEGIRGIQLIIPRMVIRELDYLKRRENLFRKAAKASSVLQWIEECIVKMSWWIHVQNSGEIMPVAPTPPATPRQEDNEGVDEFGCASNTRDFSAWGSLAEIGSPTAEDHILDCGLLFKALRSDEQIILLTDSISLKIKAMAEGLLCETAKEFRESLVNPCSERFLWVESSPRGQTWSLSEEVGLIENHCYHYPTIRKPTKVADTARGLKLVLLHNSHYGFR